MLGTCAAAGDILDVRERYAVRVARLAARSSVGDLRLVSAPKRHLDLVEPLLWSLSIFRAEESVPQSLRRVADGVFTDIGLTPETFLDTANGWAMLRATDEAGLKARQARRRPMTSAIAALLVAPLRAMDPAGKVAHIDDGVLVQRLQERVAAYEARTPRDFHRPVSERFWIFFRQVARRFADAKLGVPTAMDLGPLWGYAVESAAGDSPAKLSKAWADRLRTAPSDIRQRIEHLRSTGVWIELMTT